MKRVLTCAIALVLCATPAGAQAAFPGDNGLIAHGYHNLALLNPYDLSSTNRFVNASAVEPEWSPDGTDIVYAIDEWNPSLAIAHEDGTRDPIPGTLGARSASWSPDGTRLAYAAGGNVFTVGPDGSGKVQLTFDGNAGSPAWSPAGDRIAFAANGIWTMAVDGSERVRLSTGPDRVPDWSPDGSRIAFESSGDGSEIYVMDADGGNRTRLTFDTSTFDTRYTRNGSPARSPDGTMIAFHTDRPPRPAVCCDFDIWVMRADGTQQRRLTPTGDNNTHMYPGWQPLQLSTAGYSRPKGAAVVDVSLAPAYAQCASPDREHGPPLAFGSCASPVQVSESLTVGTPDANGAPARSTGRVRLDVLPGDPTSAADEADVRVLMTLGDVRNRASLSDYTGELEVTMDLRLTDRFNGAADAGGVHPATGFDQPHFSSRVRFTVPCAPTADTSTGGLCGLDTSADAVLPGVAREKQRAMWQLGQIRVYDGGDDGAAVTDGNTLFAVQGLFVP